MSRMVPEELVRQMYADYTAGMSLDRVGRKYGRSTGVVGAIFARRGLAKRTRGESLRGRTREVKMPLRLPEERVMAAYADYASGMSLREVSGKYGWHRQSIPQVFRRRGLELREDPRGKAARGADGRILPVKRATKKEIAQMVRGLVRIVVPAVLKGEWRHWTLERRGEFVRQVRASLEARGLLAPLPAGALSENVQRWDYGAREAHEIAARMNAGHCSRTAPVKIKLASAGLIWDGRLWSWVEWLGYTEAGRATAKGRLLLHHAVWTAETGEVLPRGAVVRMRGGNWNNLTVANMERMSRNEVVRENQARAFAARSRAMAAALVKEFQSTITKQTNEQNSSNDIILGLRRKSAAHGGGDRRGSKAKRADKNGG